MSYCTLQDLVNRFTERELVQLTDRSSTGQVDASLVADAIAFADATVDEYIWKQVQLPLEYVSEDVRGLSMVIALHYLYGASVPETPQKLYDDAIKRLEQISRGVIKLGPGVNGEAPVATNGAQMESGGRIFGRADSGGYI